MPSYARNLTSDMTEQARLENETSRFGTVNSDHALVRQLRQYVSFDQFAFGGLSYRGLGPGQGVILASDMPEAFLREFLQKRLFRIDPLAKKINSERNMATWHQLSPLELDGEDAKTLQSVSQTYRVGARTVFAFYKDGDLIGGATFTRQTAFEGAELYLLENAGRAIHQAFSEERLRAMSRHVGLSAGEIACLQAIANGSSTEDTATSLKYTRDTVSFYMKTAIKKLAASNRTHALVEAIRRGIIY